MFSSFYLGSVYGRLSAVFGGTYVLGHDVNEIVYDDQGKVSAVKFKEVSEEVLYKNNEL